VVTKAATHRSGHQIFLVFKLVQHSRDEQLMRSLVDYLGCGNIYVDASAVENRVTKFSDLTDKIIPKRGKTSRLYRFCFSYRIDEE